jgi:hypothetical protein
LWIEGDFLIAVHSFTVLLVVATSTWGAIRLRRHVERTPSAAAEPDGTVPGSLRRRGHLGVRAAAPDLGCDGIVVVARIPEHAPQGVSAAESPPVQRKAVMISLMVSQRGEVVVEVGEAEHDLADARSASSRNRPM